MRLMPNAALESNILPAAAAVVGASVEASVAAIGGVGASREHLSTVSASAAAAKAPSSIDDETQPPPPKWASAPSSAPTSAPASALVSAPASTGHSGRGAAVTSRAATPSGAPAASSEQLPGSTPQQWLQPSDHTPSGAQLPSSASRRPAATLSIPRPGSEGSDGRKRSAAQISLVREGSGRGYVPGGGRLPSSPW